jgi:hypothetical protein
MSLHAAAQHLASKGRNGDTTLVHMTKGEVAGLQAIAKQNGTSLTTNPHTGLPEAFSLKSLIPIAAGFALGPAGFGLASTAAGAGLMVGGATALGTGSLKKGLIAGLGAYGGAGLGEGVGVAAGEAPVAGEIPVSDVGTAAGSPLAPTTTAPVAPQTQFAGTDLGSMNPSGQYAGGFQSGPVSASPYSATSTNTIPQLRGATTPGSEMLSDMGQTGFSAQPMPAPTPAPAPTGVMDARTTYDPSFKSATYSGPTEASLKPQGAFDRIGANAMARPSYAFSAAAPIISDEAESNRYIPPDIKGDSDMGQRYAYESGYDASIPGRTSSPSYTKIGNEEAKKLYGFADGGDIDNSGYPGESVVRMADGGEAKHYAFGGIAEMIDKMKAQGGFESTGGDTGTGYTFDPKTKQYTVNAAGGGGISDAASHLGGYSDGGRLLRGPGDGVSDSIPAVIGRKQPARLADGEFVVPARIVSEIGNGSTEAGARKLYAMMDRVQKARGKTVGKGKVAKNTRADKYLPA